MSDKPSSTINNDLSAPQPIPTKSWLQKLLVIVLCAISFFAGWKSYQSRMIDQCLDSGGQIENIDGVYYCER